MNTFLYGSRKVDNYLQGSHAVLKVLNFKIGFQDLEKVLNLAKMYVRYWKSMQILNGKEIRSIWTYFHWRKSSSLFMQCVKLRFMINIFEKWKKVLVLNLLNLVLKGYWKSVENNFFKCVGTLCLASLPQSVLHVSFYELCWIGFTSSSH